MYFTRTIIFQYSYAYGLKTVRWVHVLATKVIPVRLQTLMSKYYIAAIKEIKSASLTAAQISQVKAS